MVGFTHPCIHNIPACRVDVTSVGDLQPLHGHNTPTWTGGRNIDTTLRTEILLLPQRLDWGFVGVADVGRLSI